MCDIEDQVKAYIDCCNIPTVFCDKDNIIAYMNDLSIKLMKEKIKGKAHLQEYEAACGFNEVFLNNNVEGSNLQSSKFYLTRQEINEKELYDRLLLNCGNDFCLYFYKQKDSTEKIPLPNFLDTELLFENQYKANMYDDIKMQVTSLVHDVRTVIALATMNEQLLYNLINNIPKEGEYEEYNTWNKKVNECLLAIFDCCVLQNQYATTITQIVEKNDKNIILSLSPYDIIEQIKTLLNIFDFYAEKSFVKLSWVGDTTPCIINTDRTKVFQIIFSILHNAIKYTGCKIDGVKNVTISIRATNKNVFVYIEDTGIGIDAEDMKHITERYFRSHRNGELAPYGKGLGLYSAYNDLLLLNGELTFSSKLGEGSIFTIKINRGEI